MNAQKKKKWSASIPSNTLPLKAAGNAEKEQNKRLSGTKEGSLHTDTIKEPLTPRAIKMHRCDRSKLLHAAFIFHLPNTGANEV